MDKKTLLLIGLILLGAVSLFVWNFYNSKPPLASLSPTVLDDQETPDDGDSQKTADFRLSDNSWRIVSLIDGQEQIDLSGYTTHIDFRESDVSGRICNNFGGNYSEIDGNIITADSVFRTEMACDPDLMKAEQAFFQGIEQGLNFSISNERILTLSDQGGMVISLEGN